MGTMAILIATTIAATAALATSANAALFGFQTFGGNVKNSNDGASSNDTVISASTEAGSTVRAAYLYTSMIPGGSTPTSVTLEGNALSYTALGANNVGLQAFRADVTSIVKPVIDAGPGGVADFAYAEGSLSSNIDGSGLVVVYENPSLPDATVAILDGFSATNGDQFIANFENPIDTADPNFFAEMALGIGFSFNSGNSAVQFSTVDVNGTRLTDFAGNFDDGFGADGGLITVGGFDDTLISTPPADILSDSERYDLTGFLSDGDTQIVVDTRNPSGDDNIFLATFYLGGKASVVNPDDPDPIPLPLPAALLMTGMGALVGIRKLRHKA